jgi:hypothetical protein
MIISIFPTIRSIFSRINPLFASKQLIFNDDPQRDRDYEQRRNSSQSSQNTQSNPNDRDGAYGKYST